ncbi:MAG TPA: hypothetical protein VIJ34_09420 [Acidimicrobiales bacterium]
MGRRPRERSSLDARWRGRATLAVVAVVVSMLCGWSAAALDGAFSHPRAAPGLRSFSVDATPGLISSSCAGGRTVSSSLFSRYVSPPFDSAPVAQETSNGVTVVAVSGATAPDSTILLRAFLPSCEPDRAFGKAGSETVNVRLGSEALPNIVITSAAPGPADSIILAGSSDDGMFVGMIDADGRIEHDFGANGWARLPWQGEPTALVREPSGDIVVAVRDGEDCCEVEFLGQISATGIVLESFGATGRAVLPDYSTGPEGAQVTQLARADNGDLLVVSTGGHMGALASVVSEFTSDGRSVTAFDRNMEAESSLLPSVFVGGVLVRPGGFLLVGAGQAGPIGPAPEPSAAGQLLPFDDDGRLLGWLGGSGASEFSSNVYWNVWAFPRPSGGYLMVAASTPYLSATPAPQRVEVVALTGSGSVDPSYADRGYGSFSLPASSGSFVPVSATSSGHAVAVVWINAGDAGSLELTEVNL